MNNNERIKCNDIIAQIKELPAEAAKAIMHECKEIAKQKENEETPICTAVPQYQNDYVAVGTGRFGLIIKRG